MNAIRVIAIVIGFFCAGALAGEQYVVEDGGVGLTREEVEYLVSLWNPDMREAAVKDMGDRIELLNMALASKKLAALADTIPPEDDPEAYWKQVFSVRSIKSRYVVNHYLASLEVPDMSALAAERYETQKDKYALVPEERYASHILLKCPPGVCDRDARRVEAQKILDELEGGADFRGLAKKYSEDPGSRDKGGQFDRWFKLGEKGIDPHFTGYVFDIEKVGDHSGIMDTQFGLHIIQLDGIRPAHYKPFDEVKDQIIADLRKEYIQLSAKEFDAGFRFTDKAYIDNTAIEEILAQHPAAVDDAGAAGASRAPGRLRPLDSKSQ